mmetsp:Transcript_14616/g.61732  ORF Transcript_14616/g.61732 Transcript_14616/m.61732 type:complete len:347 (+) Transcript_14616:1728-2768(+)
MLDDRVGKRGFEIAPPHRAALLEHLLLGHARAQLVDGEQVGRLRSRWVAELHPFHGVRLASLDLLRDLVWGVQHVDPRALRRNRFGHLRRPVRQGHDPRASLGDVSIGDAQDVPAPEPARGRPGSLRAHLLPLPSSVQVVDAPGDVTSELQVLPLILAHGHDVRVVEQDIARHEHRIVQQSHAHVLARLTRLLLELDHLLEPADWRRAVEQPAQLGVRRHVRLDEDVGALGVQPGGEVDGRGRPGGLDKLLRVMSSGGDGVEVDDAVEGVELLLHLHPVFDRAEVVTEVDGARGLDAGEDALAALGLGGSLGAGLGGRRGSRGAHERGRGAVDAARGHRRADSGEA